MFKGNNKYIWLFIGMFMLIVLVQYILPKPVNWERTYSYKDKNPYGTYAIYQLLKPTYANELKLNKNTLYNINAQDSSEKSCLILINERINLSKTDLKILYKFISEGNTVFMAANEFNGLMADTFHLNTTLRSFTYYLKRDSLVKTPGTALKLNASNYKKDKYTYPLLCTDYCFTNYDSSRFSSLSVNPDDNAVLITTKISKGHLFLMSMPDVFTNYFIVNQPNRTYAYSILSIITANTKQIIWDEYYKNFNAASESFLKLILDSDALYTAYLLMTFSIILYMITDGRRRQRAIPEIEPIKNTTLEFVNVVSHVYFNSENHKFIAEERVKYFYETIRKRFSISTQEISNEFITAISELSAYDTKLVKQLFTYCEKLKNAETIMEYDLIELNRQITNFNNKSLR